jgi:hypothetical protein
MLIAMRTSVRFLFAWLPFVHSAAPRAGQRERLDRML